MSNYTPIQCTTDIQKVLTDLTGQIEQPVFISWQGSIEDSPVFVRCNTCTQFLNFASVSKETTENIVTKHLKDAHPNLLSPVVPKFNTANLQAVARQWIYLHVKERLEKTDSHVTFSLDEVYIVWFSKVLQNWKALVSTTLPDGMYYEITFNGDVKEIYIDAYKKFENVKVEWNGP